MASIAGQRATSPGRRLAALCLGGFAPLLTAAAPDPVVAPAPVTITPTPAPSPPATVPGGAATVEAPVMPMSVTAPKPAAPRQFAWTADQAATLLKIVDGASAEGLKPAAFGRGALSDAIKAGDAARRSQVASDAALKLARAYAGGALPPSARADWYITSGSDDDRLAIGLAGVLASGNLVDWYASLLPQTDMYRALKAALVHYHDAPTRNLVMINMERWRWIPRQLGQRHVFANVPALAVEYVDGDQTTRFGAIVGKSKTATPAIKANATSVTINPYWTVPESLYGRKLAYITKHKAVAARLGYRTIKMGEKTYVQQRPGPKNALGRLKIEMPNRWDIYLHDTDNRSLFDKEARLFSHGCVRVQHVQELAALLLGNGWTSERIETQIATGKNQREPLPAPVPVYIAYLTTALNDTGEVVRLPDRYSRDAALIEAFRPFASSGKTPADEIATY